MSYNPHWWLDQPSPTQKQINLVETITDCLKIDFPNSSRDFTKWSYAKFINIYLPKLKEWQQEMRDDPPGAEEDYAWMGIDVWTPEDCY